MKHIYFIIGLLLVATTASAQIPTNYYSSATGTGYALKTQLKKIIDDVNDGLSTEYTSINLSYGDLYDTFELSDKDFYFENNGTLLDMYSEGVIAVPGPANGINDTDSYEYTYGSAQQDDGTLGTEEGQRFNREHIIPQAVFDGDTPMKNDAHFVVPTDKYVNGRRDNFPFGVVQNATLITTNGSKLGNNLNSGYSAGYTDTVFEPIDEFKGDIARMYFYFVTRYEDDMTSFNQYDMFDGSNDKCFTDTFLNILYTWHVNDPVSQREIDRNNNIDGIGNTTRQRNRNPFIDNPQYVLDIWQNELTINEFEITNTIKMFPNPAKGNVVTISTNDDILVEVYDILGKKIKSQNISSNLNKLDISRLSKGIYLVKLNSSKGSTTKKLIKQ
ncbi:ribonuclease [Flavobacteriaceae bacterium LYZ1037]|nr:ribonuclease [Flavobacteriaceae bacterium LYZ1037]